jgi:type II secretory pathway pseudopilin PulG
MTSVRQHGFTIIELILFLAISGALLTALMFGVNSNITQQRYRDSVISYRALLQQQYSEVANTRNERDDRWQCAASQVESVDGIGQPRGAGDCVLLGRYVQIKEGGTKVETGAIVGSEPADTSSLTGDITALAAYNPRRSPIDVDTFTVDWQSQLRTEDTQATQASFLMLRSPISGLVRTFGASTELPFEIRNNINEETAKAIIKSCVATENILLGPKWSVTVDSRIAGPNGVLINENDSGCQA